MKRTLFLALSIALVGVCLFVPLTACAHPAFQAQVPPMLPIRYYACTEVAPQDLYNAYLAPNTRRFLAEAQFNGEIFVFKNIKVVQAMLEHQPKNNIWVGQVICYGMSNVDIARMKAGQRYDIVGISRGVSPEWPFSIYLTECYFLRAGSVMLPAGDGPAFMPPGY